MSVETHENRRFEFSFFAARKFDSPVRTHLTKEIDQDVAVSVPQIKHTATQEEQILAGIAKEIGDSLFALWFSAEGCLEVSGNEVRVYADSDFELRRIQKGYASLVRRVATSVVGQAVQLEFLVREEADAEQPIELKDEDGLGRTSAVHQASSKANCPFSLQQNRTGAGLRIAHPHQEQPRDKDSQNGIPHRRRFLLRDLVLGPENEFTKAAIAQVLANPGQVSPMLICGGPGTGKTHLLEALTTELRTTQRLGSCIYVTSEQFTSAFVHALRGGGLPSFRRKYRDVNVLAIDDVQFFTNKRATINELQYTIDHLLRLGKQLIFASDRPPLELRDLGPEILNRLGSGLVCPIQSPSPASREAIVAKICRERQLNWPAEVCRMIAICVPRDSRRLMGAVNRICAMAAVRNSAVTESLVADILDMTPQSGSRLMTLAQVEQVAAEFLGVSSAELRSSSRMQKTGNARMIVMLLCRRATSAALSEIGEHFGGRSHSTVIAAVKRIEIMLEANEMVTLPIGRFPIREVWESLESKTRLS